MNAPSIDIRDMLLAYGDYSGLHLSFPTTLFIGEEPSMPDNSVTIFDTPGFPPMLGLITQGYEYPSVQIRVRNRKYIDGWNLADAIKNALHGRSQQTWNGALYTVIYCSSGPALLDRDDNDRFRFIVNFNLQRR
jgi:hypothetical protein